MYYNISSQSNAEIDLKCGYGLLKINLLSKRKISQKFFSPKHKHFYQYLFS